MCLSRIYLSRSSLGACRRAVHSLSALKPSTASTSRHYTNGSSSSSSTQADEYFNFGAATGSSSGGSEQFNPYDPHAQVHVEYPIVQLPSRSLWCSQYALPIADVRAGEHDEMVAKVKASRSYYQYPSLCAPQIGWNVQMFTLYDGSVFINPVNLDAEQWAEEALKAQSRSSSSPSSSPREVEQRKMAELRAQRRTGFAWEPCASCCFLMHYIERPLTARIRAVNERGETFEETLTGMRARMALHELDHLNGILFTRRVVDTNHVVPLEGFSQMSEWSDDYPSLEARSTNLYTIFTPPFTFATDGVSDGNLLNRKFEDCIYPGCEMERQMRIVSAAAEEMQRGNWRKEKAGDAEGTGVGGKAATPADFVYHELDEEDGGLREKKG